MSNFKDLLSKPLPSASSRTEEENINESVDETVDEGAVFEKLEEDFKESIR